MTTNKIFKTPFYLIYLYYSNSYISNNINKSNNKMAKAEYTEVITVKVTKDQKEYWKKQLPNPSKWIRNFIEKERNEVKVS